MNYNANLHIFSQIIFRYVIFFDFTNKFIKFEKIFVQHFNSMKKYDSKHNTYN